MSVRLEQLLANATPGPWEWMHGYPQRITNHGAILVAETFNDPDSIAYDADLIALTPDAVRLLIDMEPDLRKLAICQIGGDMEGDPACCAGCHLASLLARLDALGEKSKA